jgi:predicted alpha/beta-hydrolase family hydrolase
MEGSEPVTIVVGPSESVSGLLQVPKDARACCVLAHGAGAGMAHPFMAAVAGGLVSRGIATLRYQFPYMERGSRRPDAPKVAHAAVRAAVAHAAQRLPGTPLFAGGKSFGARMTSQAQALAPLQGVGGLVFLGFPLHPAGKPSVDRAAHLSDVRVPMLFLQGTRDELAAMDLLTAVTTRLGERATVHACDAADHSFHVPARSGRTDAEILGEALDAVTAWMKRCVRPGQVTVSSAGSV